MQQANDFASLCQELGVKSNLIELSSGKYPLQLMLATKHNWTDDGKALGWGIDFATEVIKRGWNVVRVKVETPVELGTATYYEAHWKVLIKNEEDRQNWSDFLKNKPGFLASKNIFKKGLFYLSQRVYNEPHWFANNSFTDTENNVIRKSDLRKNLEGGHYERVLYDSNPQLDAGWTVS